MRAALRVLALEYPAAMCGLLALILSFLHLGTLQVQTPNSPLHDEAALVDYANNGHLSLWRRILPPGQEQYMNTYAGGLWNGYMRTQHWIMRYLGVGPWQSRIGNAVCGLSGLFILALITRRLGLPWFCTIGMLLFGLSRPFFGMTHSARPEGYVFLAMTLNWYWFFCSESRLFSFVAGLAGIGALVFHQAAIFFLIPLALMLLFVHGKRMLRAPRFYWWVAGAAAGVVYALHMIDVDQTVQFLQLGGGAVKKPRFFHFGWSFFSFVRDSFDYLYFRSQQGSSWPPLLSGMLLMMAAQARRPGLLTGLPRQAIAIALLTVVSFSLFTASDNINYLVYLVPWLLLSSLIGADAFLRGGEKFHFSEQLLLALAHVAVTHLLFRKFSVVSLSSLLVCMLIYSDIRNKLRILAGAIALTACIAFVYFENAALQLIFGVDYLLEYRPMQLFLLTIPPWIIMLPRKLVSRIGTTGAFSTEKALLAYCAMHAFIVLNVQTQWISEQRPSVSEITPQSLRGYKRLAAPAGLWLYEPSISMQSLEAVNWMPLRGGNRVKALVEFRPDLVLWSGDSREFEAQFNRLYAGSGKKLIWGGTRRSSFEDLRELRIIQ